MQSADDMLGPDPMDYPTQREWAEAYSEWFQSKENVMHEELIAYRAAALNALIQVQLGKLDPSFWTEPAMREIAETAEKLAMAMLNATQGR